MTAEERASQLFNTKQTELPSIAFEYLKHLCSKYGGCGEVYITAFAHYAQAVEKLKSVNHSYTIDKDGRKWFKERR